MPVEQCVEGRPLSGLVYSPVEGPLPPLLQGTAAVSHVLQLGAVQTMQSIDVLYPSCCLIGGSIRHIDSR